MERGVAELKEMLEQERAEKTQLMDHNEDNKMLINKLSKEYEVTKRRLTDELAGKREKDAKHRAEMDRLRVEIDKLQSHMVEPMVMDMDILLLKTKKEFETTHNNELAEFQDRIDKLQEERDEYKRNLEF